MQRQNVITNLTTFAPKGYNLMRWGKIKITPDAMDSIREKSMDIAPERLSVELVRIWLVSKSVADYLATDAVSAPTSYDESEKHPQYDGLKWRGLYDDLPLYEAELPFDGVVALWLYPDVFGGIFHVVTHVGSLAQTKE